MRAAILFLLLLITCSTIVKAQDISEDSDQISNLADPENNSEDFTDNLIQLYQEPIDINKATKEDLQNLYLLSDFQINQLIDYRSKEGNFININELQAVNGFDILTIQKLRPLIKVSSEKKTQLSLLQRISSNTNQYAFIRSETTTEIKKGYRKTEEGTSVYKGSPWKIAGRYRNARTNDFSFNLSFEKDAGEQLSWTKNKSLYGFDYYSMHIALFNKGKVKTFCLGDYSIQLGQGLLAGSGFTLGKGAETITTTRRNSLGIKPYSSFSESGFFRGTALSYAIHPRITTTLFLSAKKLDANTDDEEAIKSMITTGYHRTENEINSRYTINEKTIGGQIQFNSRKGNFKSAINGISINYDKAFTPTTKPYTYFNFIGNKYAAGSIDYSYQWQNINLFGEAAVTGSGGKAVVQGFIASLSNFVDFSLLYRNYSTDYNSIYGNAFAENTNLGNEKGFYQGIKITPIRKLELSAYQDLFVFPWLKYQIDRPSKGSEYLIRASYNFTKKSNVFVQFKQENKEKNYTINQQPQHFIGAIEKANYTAGFKASSGIITFSSRIIYSQVANITQSSGFTIAQDLSADFRKFDLSGRFAIFDIDDYDNRHYIYEKDLLYSFYLPAYYGKGIRTYILSKIKLWQGMDLWIKISRTNYIDKTVISSGYEEIIGNTKTDLKFQLRWSL